jgi:hypothetical protein
MKQRYAQRRESHPLYPRACERERFRSRKAPLQSCAKKPLNKDLLLLARTTSRSAFVAVKKLRASRPRDDVTPYRAVRKHQNSVASCAAMRRLSRLHLFGLLLQCSTVLLWPWSMQLGDAYYRIVLHLHDTFRQGPETIAKLKNRRRSLYLSLSIIKGWFESVWKKVLGQMKSEFWCRNLMHNSH